MKKLFVASLAVFAMVFISCHNSSGAPPPAPAVAPAAAPDSAANNGVLPPSAAPGNANNSSLADTAYKAGDSVKKKH